MIFYKNKIQKFECKIEIEGASQNNVIPRLMFYPQNDNKCVVYEGTTDNGKCMIDVYPNLNISNQGQLVLEIIVDENTIFRPWKSSYEIKTEQVKIEETKITTSDKKSPLRPSIKVSVVEDDKPKKKPIKESKKKDILEQMAELIKDDNKSIFDMNATTKQKHIVGEYYRAFKKIPDKEKKVLSEYIVRKYKPNLETIQWAKHIFEDLESNHARIAMYCREFLGKKK